MCMKSNRSSDSDKIKAREPISSSSGGWAYFTAIAWYVAFGVLHECIHFLVASVVCGVENHVTMSMVKEMVFARRLSLNLSGSITSNDVNLIRHAGWSFSLLAAFALHAFFLSSKTHKNPQGLSWAIVAAYITAFDAVCTDLLGLPQFFAAIAPNQHTFCCGNFGVILLHGCWLDDMSGRVKGKSALDILEKMIEVTMMRGAQSGGVVTYSSNSRSKYSDSLHMVPARTRVVKSKRGTLSTMLRASIEKNIMTKSLFSKASTKSEQEGQVQFFSGHTRFATSSMATFDGTHPHQWTRQEYSVYDMEETNVKVAVPRRMVVENYITHNGDFEYFSLNGSQFETGTIQAWLEVATGTPMKTSVDSAAIAGMIDIIRSKGCFALSARYAICLGLPTSIMSDDVTFLNQVLPKLQDYESVGKLFEIALQEYQSQKQISLNEIGSSCEHREVLARKATEKISQNKSLLNAFSKFVQEEEEGSSPYHFGLAVVNAFFDNDLFHSVKTFLDRSLGSFGLCVTSNLDSHRQLCLASRGQTISLAFYPQKNLICFGSEQAAIKAGMNVACPGSDYVDLRRTHLNVETDVLRLDLDDVGGEICLLDWGLKKYDTPALSVPNRDIEGKATMNAKVQAYLLSESQNLQPYELYKRMTKLTKNPLITELKDDVEDPILEDIQEIPMICKDIQDGWRNECDGDFNLNRLTAWNLGRCLKQKLYAKAKSQSPSNNIDILLTGCEVSLWLAEQFGSDLQKAFPNINISTISSNKLLGLFGQEGINVPAVGFAADERNFKMKDAIIIIVSHSGGTFSPLGFSSLAQSTSDSIFVVSSEWDTQIGKQLRAMDNQHTNHSWAYKSRIFSTGVGVRAAEPCSISVAATHQLLTNIFTFMSDIILSDDLLRAITGAVISEGDLEILERLNRDNISALEDITGTSRCGEALKDATECQLRAAGDIWSEHILENAKAYVMSFLYIMGTVISGYPLVSGIAIAAGMDISSSFIHLTRFFDAVIYFFLPQINIIILRIVQGRPLRHRMVGRTVVIGDIPWVAQAAEAFLSKIFATGGPTISGPR